jgi:ribulose kinase
VRELEEMAPELHQVAGNLAMPGFTAPKLLWVRRHEPANFQRTATVLLPKDYLRYRMTGKKSPICRTPPGRCGWTWRSATGPTLCWIMRPVAQPDADAGRRLRGFRHP